MTTFRRAAAVGVVGALSLIAAIAACTTSGILDDIATFPCANDHTCPSGYACVADAGCFSSSVSDYGAGGGGSGGGEKATDAVCMAGDLCNPGSCAYGVCAAVTQANGQCATDHPIQVIGGCLRGCDDAVMCPRGLACAYLQTGNGEQIGRGCVSAAQAAVLDQSCNPTNSTPCPRFGAVSPYSCVGGACVLSCIGGVAPCPPDRVCQPVSGASPSSTTGCFADCSDGGLCSGGATTCTSSGGGPGAYCSP